MVKLEMKTRLSPDSWCNLRNIIFKKDEFIFNFYILQIYRWDIIV